MNTKLLMAIATTTVSSLAVTGCADYQYKTSDGECLTCVNNPFTGEALNYDPSKTSRKTGNSATPQTGSVTVKSSLDVDTAYARVKNEMGFTTPEEEGAKTGGMAGKFEAGDTTIGYEHSTPGANYQMGSELILKQGGQYILKQTASIQKNGSGSIVRYSWQPTDIAAQYNKQGRYDGNAVKKYLVAKLNKAVK
ncbi:hypothetical protein [Carnimonas bestiolae]|uniref:hypothetical protein n=1 Tax=Carnimonas bestiolae TaxID=3402172 RepID=UPI003F4A8E4D